MGFICCKVVLIESTLLVSPEITFIRVSAISTF